MSRRTPLSTGILLVALLAAGPVAAQVHLEDEGITISHADAYVEFDGVKLEKQSSGIGVEAPFSVGSLRFCPVGCEFSVGVLTYAANNRFQLYDDAALRGVIQTGVDDFVNTQSVFNFMGNNNQTSGDMGGDGDLFVQNDIEVGNQLYLSRELFMEGRSTTDGDGDQHIYFYDDESRSTNRLSWDDVRSDLGCSGTSPTESAFVWNLDDNSQSAWLLTNGTDVEVKVDDVGDVAIDGTLTQSGSCDLAETFLGAQHEPGTVVAIDPVVTEGVTPTTEAYQSTLVGVVSTEPGLLLNGPTADFYVHGQELALVKARLAARPGDEALLERKQQLEVLRDGWRRGDLPVALAGRVPVRVDGAYGPIRVGDPLTSSPTPGHAMAMDRPGPTLGVALEEFRGGRGKVLMLVRPGWFAGGMAPPQVELRPSGLAEGATPSARRPRRQTTTRRVRRTAPETVRVAGGGVAGYRPVSEPVETGDVLVVDRAYPEFLKAGSIAADAAVVGIVSGRPGILTGSRVAAVAEVMPELARQLERARTSTDREEQARIWRQMEQTFEAVHAPVATSGIVAAKVDASYGPIAIGDLLTVSATPGYAARAESPRPGTIVAKALEPLASGRGLIDVLVMPR